MKSMLAGLATLFALGMTPAQAWDPFNLPCWLDEHKPCPTNTRFHYDDPEYWDPLHARCEKLVDKTHAVDKQRCSWDVGVLQAAHHVAGKVHCKWTIYCDYPEWHFEHGKEVKGTGVTMEDKISSISFCPAGQFGLKGKIEAGCTPMNKNAYYKSLWPYLQHFFANY